jgi:hypothetical protein
MEAMVQERIALGSYGWKFVKNCGQLTVSMKKSDKVKKDGEQTMLKVRAIARHIRNVEDNSLLLGEKLIQRGEIDLGKRLIANGMIHDASKFHGIEFEYLSLGNPSEESAKLKLKLSVHHHNTTNPHHPEYWAGGIKEMPDVYLAEMVCDWKARSEEFGTSLRDWIEQSATKRWGFVKDDKTYKEIMAFVDLLCEKPFEQLSQT